MKSLVIFFGKLTVEKKATLLLFTPIFTVLLTAKSILLALAIFILLDLLTGIRKSLHIQDLRVNPFKRYFWRAVQSKGMRSTWRKSYEYAIGIIVFAILESYVLRTSPMDLLGRSLTLTEMVIIAATLVEMYSIFENMEAVSGRNLLKRIMFLLPVPVRRILGETKEQAEADMDSESDSMEYDNHRSHAV